MLPRRTNAALAPPSEPAASATLSRPDAAATVTQETAEPRSNEEEIARLRPVARETFTIDGELGRGGLGRVLLARDPSLDRPVALKEVLRDDPGAIARFVREARITARLQHPNIVPVYEAGRWPSGEPFYAMRLISGRTLGSVIKGTTSLEERLSLIPKLVAVADAVAYAHSQRIIHRDLKPDNVLVGAFGETVVIDWGLAKDLAGDADDVVAFGSDAGAASALTVAGARIGTPAYMAPEQARGEPLDERADVWALGALMYHALTGAPPFRGPSADAVLALAASSAPADIEDAQPGVPRDLATIVRKAMAPRPADRYPSARELADDLRRFETGQLVSARRYSRSALFARWLRRHRIVVAVAAASIAVLAITLTVSVQRIVRERNRAAARTEELVLAQARISLDRDPTAAVAWLMSYPAQAPGWSEARVVADDARASGVARHVFAVPGSMAPSAIAFEGDGRHLVALGEGSAVRWDVATGARAGERTIAGAWPAFVPQSGALLVTGADGALEIAPPLANGGVSRRIQGIGGRIHAIATSDDGRWIAVASETAIVLSSASGEVKRTLDAPPSAVLSLAISRDGARIAAATDDRAAWVWQVASGERRRLDGNVGKLAPLVFLPDGSRLAGASEDGAVMIWSAPTGEARLLRGHAQAPVLVAASPDGARIASADGANEIRIWDVATGEGRAIGAHKGYVMALLFSPDGALLASTSQDETLHLVRLATGETAVFRGHGAIDAPLAFSPDGRLLATGGGGEVRVWDVHPPSGRALRGHDGRVTHSVFSPDGKLLATCAGRHVHLWDAATGALVRRGEHDDEVYGLAFSPDGKVLASASFDATVRLWDARGGAADRILRGHEGRVRDVVFAPDGATIATAGQDGTVRLWDPSSGDGKILGRAGGSVARVAFSPDGKQLASSSKDRAIRLWNIAGGAPRVLGEHVGDPFILFFLRDGRLVSAAEEDVKIWDPSTGAARTVAPPAGFDGRAIVSPDGRLLVLPVGERLVVIDLATGAQRELRGHDRPVQRCRFSHDGKRLVSASLDGTVRLWDIATGAVRTVHRHEGVVFDASFSPDDTLVASASSDKTAWIGPVDEDAADALAPDAASIRGALVRWTTARVGADNHVRSP